jgi:hypothetical protein
MATSSTTDIQSQLDKFKQAARALECDEDEEAFKRSLRKVAKAKPAPVKPK